MVEVAGAIGRYGIVREIGRGGMAVVYLAEDSALGRLVALKELVALGVPDASLAERFVREARVAGSLNHPNIVTVYDFFEHDGVPYIAMEYVPGGSLRPLVGRLGLAQIAGVLEGVLDGLAHAERRGIVHRDLKPENLLVTDEGKVKIADFGIAKALNRTTMGHSLTATGTAIGTPAYMAPEQALGREVGCGTDLYALGVVAYELLTGRVPFQPGEHDTPLAVLYHHVSDPVPDPTTLQPGLDRDLADWTLALLQKEAAHRPASAAQAWHALEPLVMRLAGPLWRQAAALAAGSGCPEPAPTTAAHVAPPVEQNEREYETFRPRRPPHPAPEPRPVSAPAPRPEPLRPAPIAAPAETPPAPVPTSPPEVPAGPAPTPRPEPSLQLTVPPSWLDESPGAAAEPAPATPAETVAPERQAHPEGEHAPRQGEEPTTSPRSRLRLAASRRRLLAYALAVVASLGAVLIGLSVIPAHDGTTPRGTTPRGTTPRGTTPSSSARVTVAGTAQTAALLRGIPQHGNVLGLRSAPVRLVEYADPQCRYCARYARDVLPTLVRTYVRTGRVQLVFRGLSFLGPDSSTALGTAAAAASENRLWNVLELLYRNQGAENAWVSDGLLRAIVTAAGANPTRVFAARHGGAVKTMLDGWKSLARAAGIDAVPAFYVGLRGGALERLQVDSLTVPPFSSALDHQLRLAIIAQISA